jgi:hypothetical protein
MRRGITGLPYGGLIVYSKEAQLRDHNIYGDLESLK